MDKVLLLFLILVLFTPHCIVCFFFTIYTVNPSDPNMNTLIIWMWVFYQQPKHS